MKITKEFLEGLNPCADRWKNYLKYYSDWTGSLAEFLELDKITTEDKLWVFTRPVQGWGRMQRRFAVAAAERVCKDAQPEVKKFFALVKAKYESVNYDSNIEHLKDAAYMAAFCAADIAAYSAANSAAYSAVYSAVYSAAYWVAYSAADIAAYWAADMAAEREAQIEILKKIVGEEKIS